MVSPLFPPTDQQLVTLRRGTAEVIVESELRAKLDRRRPLRVKLGLDPTAPDLHLGHTVVLEKLRDFQQLGHQIIMIIGDFTGMIGDPTGRSETRKQLTRDEVAANAETYRGQLGRVLDLDRTRLVFNSAWLSPLRFDDVVRETAHLTVARMLQREDFAARHAAGRPISLHEFLYPVAQAYDSVALEADVELGGTDQTFNLLVGRDLQRAHGQDPQVALTVPILPGLDGVQKMSKSLGNAVGLTDPPDEMYGKLMSLADDTMWLYFELLTRLAPEEIAALRAGHPMEAKKRLAQIITAQYHGEGAADGAATRFTRLYQQRLVPADVEECTIRVPLTGVPLPVALKEAGVAPSTSEARRMVGAGAVDIDGERVGDVNRRLLPRPTPYLIRVGKHRFRLVRLVEGISRAEGA